MALEEAVYAMLHGDATVASLVSDRIYPSNAKQDCARPYIVYHLISQTRFPAMGGDTNVIERRIQVDSYDDTHGGVATLSAAITAALNRAGGTYASVVVQQVFESGMQDFGLNAESRLYRRAADYLIYYEG